MAPTLTATGQTTTGGGAATRRVLLVLTWPGISTATIQRLDPDGVLRNVRNAEPATCYGSCALFDGEVPFDQAVTYQATSPQNSGGASDLFGRTVSNGWGSADTGQAYTTAGGSAADFSVTGSKGQHSNGTVGVKRFTTLDTTVGTDFRVDVDTLAAITSAATQPVQQWVIARMTDTSNFYAAKIEIGTGGIVNLRITKTVAGVVTDIAGPFQVDTGHVAADTYRVSLMVQGSTLQAKAWFLPGTEPATWALTVTDTSLTTGTLAGVMSTLVTGNTNTSPVLMTYDNLLVTSLSPLTVTSGSVTVVSSGQAWLTHPGHPAYDGAARVAADSVTELRPARRGVFAPIGTSLPVVVSDVRTGASGSLAVNTSTTADITRLRNMLADGNPQLLRQPLTWGGDTWWVSVGDVGVARLTDSVTDNQRRWTLPFQRVDRPSGAGDGAVGQTWNDVKATYATWNAEKAAKATWTALNQSVI